VTKHQRGDGCQGGSRGPTKQAGGKKGTNATLHQLGWQTSFASKSLTRHTKTDKTWTRGSVTVPRRAPIAERWAVRLLSKCDEKRNQKVKTGDWRGPEKPRPKILKEYKPREAEEDGFEKKKKN